jgi:UTP--glucose-1-phosphate uridylyltransferase
VFGRYILTREIFSFLNEVAIDNAGDVTLSDALGGYCDRYSLFAVRFEGRYYDAGDPFGLFIAKYRT